MEIRWEQNLAVLRAERRVVVMAVQTAGKMAELIHLAFHLAEMSASATVTDSQTVVHLACWTQKGS